MKIKLFDTQQVRAEWDAEQEKWWFSVVDIVTILTEHPSYTKARKYWSVLKTRLKKEGSQLATNCSQLKLTAADGKKWLYSRNSVMSHSGNRQISTESER